MPSSFAETAKVARPVFSLLDVRHLRSCFLERPTGAAVAVFKRSLELVRGSCPHEVGSN
jgi:hypothetical protein